MKWFITIKKATASAVNVTVVFIGSAPIYFVAGIEAWRLSCVVLFFLYSRLLSRRCLGQMVARTYQNEPTNTAYAALYTASFATMLWWIFVPLDLALANGLFIQLPCLLIYGNTAHGLATGRRTLTDSERMFESIVMKGQCPDCNQVKLEANGPYVHCKSCHSMFIAQEFFVRRVEPTQAKWPQMKTGDVIRLQN